MIVARLLLAAPIVVRSDPNNASLKAFGTRTVAISFAIDGASRLRAIWELLSWLEEAGLLTAFLFAFGRAISEVNAIIVVGGNIRSLARTMTTSDRA